MASKPPLRLRPGTRTVVAMYSDGAAVSDDGDELKMRFDAGREYQVRVHTEFHVFRKGRWAPCLVVRPVTVRSPQPPADARKH